MKLLRTVLTIVNIIYWCYWVFVIHAIIINKPIDIIDNERYVFYTRLLWAALFGIIPIVGCILTQYLIIKKVRKKPQVQ